jgi:hypothetical protein
MGDAFRFWLKARTTAEGHPDSADLRNGDMWVKNGITYVYSGDTVVALT